MRGRPFLVAVAAFVLSSAARDRLAHADDELPSGSDPPRIVPIAVVDAYYAFHDSAPSRREATLMTTAVRHDEFAINLAAIGARFEHSKVFATVILQAGTSVDALYPPPPGDNTHYVRTPVEKFSGPEVWKHIQQASAGYRFTDVTVEVGVFPSHIGNEGFVSTGNWNYTRAIVSDITPYFVGGVKVTAKLGPTLSAAVLAYNSWSNAFANYSRYKSGGFRVDWKPSDTLSVFDAVHVGPAPGDNGLRVFDDLVINFRLFTKLSLAGEGWIGADRTSSGTQTAPYFGGALWARYTLGETTYVAGRGEIVVDKDGVLTGSGERRLLDPTSGRHVVDADGNPTPDGQTILGGTLTVGWQPHPNFIARAEALYRTANQPFFSGGGNSADPVRKSSTTFVANVAFRY